MKILVHKLERDVERRKGQRYLMSGCRLCGTCGGTGISKDTRDAMSMSYGDEIECPRCEGWGRLWEEVWCADCGLVVVQRRPSERDVERKKVCVACWEKRQASFPEPVEPNW